jgi:LysR family transcriptional regulator, benzoate and cis,cis-muconate-responsive activator of ben and cat genes
MWYTPTLQQLLFLETVLEEGGLVRAADRLHTTHSTISRSLKALSSGLGISLFDKTPQGLRLSRIGRIYSAQIRNSLEQAKLAFDLARYEVALHQRPFYVGHSPYICSALLPVLGQMRLSGTEAPPIVLKSAPTLRLVRRVRHGELRAGFGVLPIVDTSLWIERVAHEPFCIPLPEHHRLAGNSRLAARELSQETLIWIPRHTHPLFYDQIISYLLTLSFNPRRFLEADTITQALDFTAHRCGVALVPQSASRFQRPGVLFKPLTDDLIRIETALFVRKDQMHSSMQDFMKVARSTIAAQKLNATGR